MNVVTPIARDMSQAEFLDVLHEQKYRDPGQTHEEFSYTLARSLATNAAHEALLFKAIKSRRIVPAGRIQAALGSNRQSTPFNCAVADTIPDSMEGIMRVASEAAMTLRLGCGIGYDFSTIRPLGHKISTLLSQASGPVSFMGIFAAMCKTIHMSHRRGAQMAMLNVHHPDILDFIGAKNKDNNLSTFNISVAVTHEFMQAVLDDAEFELRFPVDKGPVSGKLKAKEVWDLIIRNAWEHNEPGVIFIDRMNDDNNLYYCEDIRATNPCGEQPLPPYGMCLLGSLNLPNYLIRNAEGDLSLDMLTLGRDIRASVEAYDNVITNAIYPSDKYKEDMQNKRRMGLNYLGLATALQCLGYPYGSPNFLKEMDALCYFLMCEAYSASIRLAEIRGPFKLYEPAYCQSQFVMSKLPANLRMTLEQHGIRNSHLISWAPNGTISLTSGNVSSGVEPVFYDTQSRRIILDERTVQVNIKDWGLDMTGIKPKVLDDCTVADHINVSAVAQTWCDSAVSKTINVAKDCTYEEYADAYMQAFREGLKGVTVYKPSALMPPVIASGDCADGTCTI